MRPVTRRHLSSRVVCLSLLALFVGCAATQKPKDPPPEFELELTYDDGQPTERPLLPPAAFEWLVKFEPHLPAFRPLRLRVLIAQPGALRLVVYAADANGRPGTALRTIEKTYAPELTSSGQDGKWLLESLSDLPAQSGPIFVGVSAPTPGNDAARLWAGARPSPQIFQRDAEPSTAMQSSRLPLTPMLRLVISPTAPPPAPPVAPPSEKPAAFQPPPAAVKGADAPPPPDSAPAAP